MDFREVDKRTVSRDLLRFADYCLSLTEGGPMPHRHSFEVRTVPWLFGLIATVDVLDGGADYRFAYSGDLWKLALHCDLTGLRLSEIEASSARMPLALRTHYDAAVRARAPRYRFGRWIWPDEYFIRLERLIVPFAGKGGAVSMLVVAVQCEKSIGEIMEECRHRGEPRLELELSRRAVAAA